MSNEQLRRDVGQFFPQTAEEIVVEAQKMIQRYLPPDSGISAKDALSEIIGLLDTPQARRIFEEVEARRPDGWRGPYPGFIGIE